MENERISATGATPSKADPKKAMDKKHMARIAAVQALFAHHFEPQSHREEDLAQFLVKHYNDRREQEADTVTPDKRFFKKLFAGALKELEATDTLIAKYLSDDWQLGTIDPVLLAILRAATYELYFFADVPPKVVINEYVEITQHYFSDVECKLVNAVLDTMYKARTA